MITIVLQDFRGGGAEKVAVLLANGLCAEGNSVKIICGLKTGPMLQLLNKKIEIIELGSKSMFTTIPKLVKHFRSTPHSAILSHMTHVNVATLIAAILAKSHSKTIVVEHNMMAKNYEAQKNFRVKIAYHLTKVLYRFAKSVVAVSQGVNNSVLAFANLSPRKVVTIFNPVLSPSDIDAKASMPAALIHPFFEKQVKVFLGVGSLTKQKNFDLFIRAFSEARKLEPCKAIIIGEGPLRKNLQELINRLGISEDIELAGFVTNPQDFMRSADTFILSSLWEGLPTVLIEAISTRINIISTDCPSGPQEILLDGVHGMLVSPSISPSALAGIMLAGSTIDKDNNLERARCFTIENAVKSYQRILFE